MTARVTSDDLGLVIVATIGALITAAFFLWAFLQAARSPPPVALVLALSMLTLIALGGFIVTKTDTLGTIAATGVGAIAGVVASQFKGGPPPEQ